MNRIGMHALNITAGLIFSSQQWRGFDFITLNQILAILDPPKLKYVRQTLNISLREGHQTTQETLA